MNALIHKPDWLRIETWFIWAAVVAAMLVFSGALGCAA